jgi:hypothetical protein
MQRAASLTLVISGLAFAILYWATTGLGHDRDAAIRFFLATILWGGLVITIGRQTPSSAAVGNAPRRVGVREEPLRTMSID